MKNFRLHHAGLLFLVAVITYLPFFWERGFYWDEAPWTWIYFRLGPDALTRTFSTSRPFWGMLYQLTLPLGGANPWVWQLAMIGFRFFSAYLFYRLLKLIWKADPFIPESASLLFLVYPGLSQNYLGLMYTHFYIVLSVFISSFLFSSKALQPKKGWFHIPAILFAIANILMMEYFYFLELLRPLFFWQLLSSEEKRVHKTATHSAPYLLSFFAVTLWRLFFFTNQNASYTYGSLEAIKADPINGLFQLLRMMGISFINTAVLVWARGLEIFNISETGVFTLAGGLVIAAILTALLFIFRQKNQSFRPSLSAYLAAFAVWLFSGGAFWLVGVRTLPELHFSADRFSMPFMTGASLLAALLLSQLKFEKIRNGILIAIIAIAGAWQFSAGRAYAQDRVDHDRFFSQLMARVPSLLPNTTIITNDLPFTYYSDNSLSGTLNWIYSEPGKMQTILYYASVRSADGRALGNGFEPDQPIEQNYLARVFYGNTNDVLVFEYAPPGCLRLLDPDIDPQNKLLPQDLRAAAKLSNPNRITFDRTQVLPPHVIPRTNEWCDAYQNASIAASNKDWDNVVSIFENEFEKELTPQAPMENLILIEAYARTGEWNKAFELSENIRAYSKNYTTPPLCALWERVQRESDPSDVEQATINEGLTRLGCGLN